MHTAVRGQYWVCCHHINRKYFLLIGGSFLSENVIIVSGCGTLVVCILASRGIRYGWILALLDGGNHRCGSPDSQASLIKGLQL